MIPPTKHTHTNTQQRRERGGGCQSPSIHPSMASFLLLLLFSFLTPPSTLAAHKKTYIIRVNNNQKPDSFPTHIDWYTHSLTSLGANPTSDLLYDYDAAFHGYAASLTEEQADSLRSSPNVLRVYEDAVYQLHTTRTPAFVGVNRASASWHRTTGQDLCRKSHDVVIGVFDTGVWPYSGSFHDDGMPPVPEKWKGKCELIEKKNPCNRKLIGFRSFHKGYTMNSGIDERNVTLNPLDSDGHGTHTASTAAGSSVARAGFQGYATGTAVGMAPCARLAVYKICWEDGCFSSDILKAMNRAIKDGVDVFSMSIGSPPADYFHEATAIGGFHALTHGIFVSLSAGNSGPSPQTVANVAPWVTTVAAGSLDRRFPAIVNLGNGKAFEGASLYQKKGAPGDDGNPVPLVMADTRNGSLCMDGYLTDKKIAGAVVLCVRGIVARLAKGVAVKKAGGVGMVLANTVEFGDELIADGHVIPASMVGNSAGKSIFDYIKNSRNPTVSLVFKGTEIGVRPSPSVAGFSSRGPNVITPEILKPDIMAPGLNILAAWTGSDLNLDSTEPRRRMDFNVISGTSMSCPHISGLAALVKAAHPNWSPSAIKSAMMTTASVTDNTGGPLTDITTGNHSNPFGYGAGEVQIGRALYPGLVYDAQPEDYIAFLCSMNYEKDMTDSVRQLTQNSNANCSRKLRSLGDLNYPSFSVVFKKAGVVTYERELTSVEKGASVYRVVVDSPSVVKVEVVPEVLHFSGLNVKRKYSISFSLKEYNNEYKDLAAFGRVLWSSRNRLVHSPVAFMWI